MTRCVFAIPGDLATPAGGYVYARKIIPLLAERLPLEIRPLPRGFPLPSEAEVREAMATLAAACAPNTVLFIDGLAYGALPARALAALKSPVVALVHHPLGLEDGLSAAHKADLLKTEEEALALARQIVVPSDGARADAAVSRLAGQDHSRRAGHPSRGAR